MAILACRLCQIREAVSEEHVIPDALGGKRIARGFLCAHCNNGLGKRIDAPLEESLRPFSTLLGGLRGDRRPVAPIDRVATTTGETITLGPGGRPMGLLGKPIQVQPRPDGTYEIEILSTKPEKAAERLYHKCRELGVTPAQFTALTVSEMFQPVEGVTLSTELGHTEHFRSVAKMGLAALVRRYTRTAIDDAAFDQVAEFILIGSDEALAVQLDPSVAGALRSWSEAEIGQHLLCVYNNVEQHCVEVIFSAFGVFPFRVLLTPNRPPAMLAKSILHVVDLRAWIHHERTVAFAPRLGPCRRSQPEYSAQLQAVTDLLGYVQAVQQDRWSTQVAHDIGSMLEEMPNGVMTAEHVARVAEISAEAILGRIYPQPREEEVDPTGILAMVQERLEADQKLSSGGEQHADPEKTGWE